MDLKKSEPRIPDIVLERLALYHCLLQEWILTKRKQPVTSKEISRILGLTDETVRRDLSFLSQSGGKPGVGYDVEELFQIIGEKLSMEDRVPIVVVGSIEVLDTLLSIFELEKFGFIVEAVFSENPEDKGKAYRGVRIKSLDEIDADNIPEGCRLAVVMTHKNWANYSIEKLHQAGIKGVLNLTPMVVSTFPEGMEGIQLRYPCYLKVLLFKTSD